MRCREASEADALAIAALHAESWRIHYRGAYRDDFLDGPVVEDRLAVWQERLSAPPRNQLVVLAEDRGHLVGFACAYGSDDTEWGTLLDNLHVRQERQRQGTGRRLVSEVAGWCRTNHPDCGLYLWVLTGNRRARSFYERVGATDRGGETFVPPGGGEIRSRRYAWATLDEVQGNPPAEPW